MFLTKCFSTDSAVGLYPGDNYVEIGVDVGRGTVLNRDSDELNSGNVASGVLGSGTNNACDVPLLDHLGSESI